jgi:hypothetical protein
VDLKAERKHTVPAGIRAARQHVVERRRGELLDTVEVVKAPLGEPAVAEQQPEPESKRAAEPGERARRVPFAEIYEVRSPARDQRRQTECERERLDPERRHAACAAQATSDPTVSPRRWQGAFLGTAATAALHELDPDSRRIA